MGLPSEIRVRGCMHKPPCKRGMRTGTLQPHRDAALSSPGETSQGGPAGHQVVGLFRDISPAQTNPKSKSLILLLCLNAF